jgi:hypothetical protein
MKRYQRISAPYGAMGAGMATQEHHKDQQMSY